MGKARSVLLLGEGTKKDRVAHPPSPEPNPHPHQWSWGLVRILSARQRPIMLELGWQYHRLLECCSWSCSDSSCAYLVPTFVCGGARQMK